MAKVLKKQLKLQQSKVTALAKTDNAVINRPGSVINRPGSVINRPGSVISRPGSVSRSGNFTIREPRSSLIDKPSTCPT